MRVGRWVEGHYYKIVESAGCNGSARGRAMEPYIRNIVFGCPDGTVVRNIDYYPRGSSIRGAANPSVAAIRHSLISSPPVWPASSAFLSPMVSSLRRHSTQKL